MSSNPESQEEKWIPVVGYEGLYEVSNFGRVRSLDRQTKGRFGFKTQPGRYLKPEIDKAGYHRVQLSNETVIKHHLIHRLVTKAFIAPIIGSEQVNHIDGDKSNNHSSNLEWSTPRENIAHAIRTGLINYKSGTDHPMSKRTTCLKGHDLIEENIYHYKGQRVCKICRRANFKSWQQRERLKGNVLKRVNEGGEE